MVAANRNLGAGLALLMIVSSGCAGPVEERAPTGPWQTWRSSYVTYHTRPDDPLSDASDVFGVESKLVDLWSYLGIPAAERHPVEWYRFRDPADWQARDPSICPGEAVRGCARGVTLFATSEVLEHELVHAALAGSGEPPQLLAEGLALALSCLPQEEALPHEVIASDWRSLVASEASVAAGKLTLHLLRTFGPSAYLALYRSSHAAAPADDLASAFQSTFGSSLDTVWAAAQSDPSLYHCAPFWPCRRAAPPDSTFELSRSRGDADSGLLLPGGASKLHVEQGQGSLAVRACDGVGVEGALPVLTANDTWVFPGHSAFAVQVLFAAPAILSITPLAGDATARCDEVSLIPITEFPSLQPVLAAPFDDVRLLGIASTASSALQIGDPVPFLPGQDGWFLDACASCRDGQATDCTAMGGARFSGPAWLRLSRDPTEPKRALQVTLGFH